MQLVNGDSDGRVARFEGNAVKGRRDLRRAEADAVRERFGERLRLRRSSSRNWSVLHIERCVRCDFTVAGQDCPRGEGLEEARTEGINCGSRITGGGGGGGGGGGRSVGNLGGGGGEAVHRTGLSSNVPGP